MSDRTVPTRRWIRDLPELLRGSVRTARSPARLTPGQRSRWKEMTAWRHLSSPWRVLPDFVVIGAQRGGTTSLYRNLITHAQIATCIRKEVHYFDAYFEEGPYWYRGHFPTAGALRRERRRVGGPVLTGEATPMYLVDPICRARLAELLPDAKLFVLLRDPVARAYSQYQVRVVNYDETASFETILEKDLALQADDPAALMSIRDQRLAETFPTGTEIARGLYTYQLEHLFELFPRENVFIEASEVMFADEEAYYRRACEFLGIADFAPDTFVAMRPPKYPDIEPETQERLDAFFRPHNERLFELLGRRLPWGRPAGPA
ncbi:MAG: sulfotransferase domain-containing protein [Myxococcota bacterium]|nr:sulfotransferase domain-containing protein [Myxococcota bacterium]